MISTFLKTGRVVRGERRLRLLAGLLVAAALLLAGCGATAGSPPGGGGYTTGAANTPKPTHPPAGMITEFPVAVEPVGITAGPDGNLWFTECFDDLSGGCGVLGGTMIGRITPSGQITTLPDSGGAFNIKAGPDGNVWLTDGGSAIGRITPGGQVTNFPLPTDMSVPEGITAGPDGNMWFTEYHTGNIGRITTGK